MASFPPALGPQIDHPVRGPDHVEVVLDDDERVAFVDQAAQRAQQRGDVVEVKPGGGLVEEKEGARLVRRARFPGLGEVAGELEALGLAAAQGGDRLAEPHVLEADRDQGLERALHLGLLAKERDGLGGGHVEHVGDGAGPPGSSAAGIGRQHRDFEHLRAVAPAVAVRAAQIDVAEELHLDVLESAASAGRAAPLTRVEAEGARGVAALDRERLPREHLADRVQRPDVTRGVGARGLPDRRLVDHHHVPDMFVAADLPVPARGVRRLAGELAQAPVADVFHQGRLARAAHAGDADETAERNTDVDVLEVVLRRPEHFQAAAVPERGAGRRAGGDPLLFAQVLRGERCAALEERGRGAEEHHLAAALSRPWSDVEHPVRREHDLRVVLHHEEGVAGVAQPVQHADHAAHVARVEPDARLVEHEERVDERGAERGGEVDALHLATAQGA